MKKVANFQETENRLREITNYGKIQNPLPRATRRAFSIHLPALIAMCWGNVDRQQDRQRETLLRTISTTLDNDALIITELMQSAREREVVFSNMLEFSHSQASTLAMEFSLTAIEQLGSATARTNCPTVRQKWAPSVARLYQQPEQRCDSGTNNAKKLKNIYPI